MIIDNYKLISYVKRIVCNKIFHLSILFLLLSQSSLCTELIQTDRCVKNLAIFTKMYGALRYFYPCRSLKKINWEQFLINGSSKVLTATNDSELVSIINNFYSSESVYLAIIPLKSEPQTSIYNSRKYKYWKHNGYGQSDNAFLPPFFNFIYRNFLTPYGSRIATQKNKCFQDSTYTYLLEDSIFLHIRHFLPKCQGKCVRFKTSMTFNSISDDDSILYRISAVIYFWSILRNFYPYPEVVAKEWDSILKEALSKTIEKINNESFLQTLNKLTAEVNDGHAQIINIEEFDRQYTPPVSLSLVDSTIFVTGCKNCDSLGLKVGDELLKIDGNNALQLLEEISKYVSAATYHFKNYRALYRILEGLKGTFVTLTLRDSNDSIKHIILERTNYYFKPDNPIPVKKIIDQNIIYLDANRASSKKVKQTIATTGEGEILIIDLRPFPNVQTNILRTLMKSNKMESQKWLVPEIIFPFQYEYHYDSTSWVIRGKKPSVKCNIIFLINGEALSYSETFISFIKYYNIGTLIGEPTAGSNGNVVSATFDKKYRLLFTGMRVLNQDGSNLHGYGIPPDIEVRPTYQGMRNGKDEILDRAIEYAKSFTFN